MGLLWISKLYNAKPVPKAVPMIGSIGMGAWQVEYQGKAGYAWQVVGPGEGMHGSGKTFNSLGLAFGFYQAVIDAFYWARKNLAWTEADSPDGALNAVIGPYIVTAASGVIGAEGEEFEKATLVWPGGAVSIGSWIAIGGEGPFVLSQDDRHDPGAEFKPDGGALRFTIPDDQLLAVTLFGLQHIVAKGAGKLLEGKK